MLKQGASDLHLTVNAPPMIRVDGGLRPADGPEPWQRDKVLSALGSLLTEEQRAIFEAELELDFAYTLPDTARFRVNYYQQRGSLGGSVPPDPLGDQAARGTRHPRDGSESSPSCRAAWCW